MSEESITKLKMRMQMSEDTCRILAERLKVCRRENKKLREENKELYEKLKSCRSNEQQTTIDDFLKWS